MGRRRKRRKKIIIWRPTMPTRYRCPNCEAETLVIEINKKEVDERGYYKAIIKCGSCGLYAEMWVPPIYQPVDVYSKFLDEFLEGKAEYKILKPAEERKMSLEEALGGYGEVEGEGSEEATGTEGERV